MNEQEIVAEAPRDLVKGFPTPAEGRFVIVDGRLALLWKAREGQEVWSSTDGFLLNHGHEGATWLPVGWVMNVFPAGWKREHVEHWLQYAIGIVEIEERPDIPKGSKKSLAYAPTPRKLVAHAHLILRHLNVPGAPKEPQTEIDQDGCLAELRDVLVFLRGAAEKRENPLPKPSPPNPEDGSNYRPMSEFLDRQFFTTIKRLEKILKANPWVRQRKPSLFRRELHAADMMKLKAKLNQVADDAQVTFSQIEAGEITAGLLNRLAAGACERAVLDSGK
jgi:hypothetical protein